MKDKHPYTKYEESQLWTIIENSLEDLIKNQDIELTTRKEYVIGYICKKLKTKFKQLEDE